MKSHSKSTLQHTYILDRDFSVLLAGLLLVNVRGKELVSEPQKAIANRIPVHAPI